MPLTILVSFSVLALVVTARPILPDPEIIRDRSTNVQHAVQAIFQSDTVNLPDSLFSDTDDVHVQVTTAQEQNEYLSQLDTSSVKAVLPLAQDGVQTDSGKKLYDMLSGGLNDLDGGVRSPDELRDTGDTGVLISAEASTSAEEKEESDTLSVLPSVMATSPPVLVLILSCVAALMALACIATTLYVSSYLRTRLLASHDAWEMLPRLEKRGTVGGGEAGSTGTGEGESLRTIMVDSDEKESTILHPSTPKTNEEVVLPDEAIEKFEDKSPAEVTGNVEHEDDDEDFNEKFEDALDLNPSPLMQPHDLPQLVVTLHADESADPDFMSLPSSGSSRPPSPQPIQMREAHPHATTPVSRPAWSLRASDAPTLTISPRQSVTELPLMPQPSTSTSIELQPSRRKAYRSPVPEFDIALAMQLRPGLGIGADPAWMVRFLMAIFGWFTVLLTGNRGSERRQRLQ